MPVPPRIIVTGRPGPPRRLLRGGERLRHMIGRRLLVGITVRGPAGEIVERRQFHGPVVEVADGVVVLQHTLDGAQLLLPADPDAYELARPGTYRLLSGDVVVDPDYLGAWDVTAGDGDAPHPR